MQQSIVTVALVVPDYDEALAFFVGTLGFELLEDTAQAPGKRFVRVAPRGGTGAALLLAKAATEEQRAAIGNQTGGRVFLFLHTDDFDRDHGRLVAAGIEFTGPPRDEPYGKVAVFVDPFGNKWDLVQPAA